MKNIIFLAVQGAGKGTFAKKLKEKYGYAHISTGDILRERAAVGDELGNKIKDMIDNGKFVPDDIIFDAVEFKITQPECEKGYILDGFPRNLAQAEGYSKILEKLGKDLGVVINLTIPEELLKQRIIGRRLCRDCGAIYNIYNEAFQPKVEGVCDKCGGELYQRDDDNEESMNTRVKTYYEVTEPIIDYYKEQGVLHTVDSSQEVDTVFSEIEKILGSEDVNN
ncbi:MAG: adenylate kinase [Bacilli bacterium]|jgi:adenylate kinase|nr:adenylate kinase [Bacilli bacterium]